jgi:hypothetical protein
MTTGIDGTYSLKSLKYRQNLDSSYLFLIVATIRFESYGNSIYSYLKGDHTANKI